MSDLILGIETSCDDTAVAVVDAEGKVHSCLDDADVKVVCPANLQPMPAGDVLTFFLRVNAAIPRADAATSYIYSVVLDSDGVGANDWRFVAPFDWDYFQGTDRWYQLSWNHMTRAWSLTATQVDASQQTAVVPTTARAVLAGDSIVFQISATELAAARGYRLSALATTAASPRPPAAATSPAPTRPRRCCRCRSRRGRSALNRRGRPSRARRRWGPR